MRRVVETLLGLLSDLHVTFVPAAETFRRAKFNTGGQVVEDFWRFLHSLFSKALRVECECSSSSSHQHVGSRLVRSALWQCGYGASWVCVVAEGGVGSRELLLAFGWLLSSGRLLDLLLTDRTMELDLLSLPTLTASLRDEGCPLTGRGGLGAGPAWAGLLRRLQWRLGRLRIQRRSLMSSQEERARLLHLVLSSSSFPSSSPSHHQHNMDSTALRKECEGLQALCELMEVYLLWKRLEPLFWCWMDSVVEQITDLNEEDLVDVSPSQQTVGLSCPHGNKSRRGLELLDNMQLQPAGHTHTPQVVVEDEEEVRRRVALRLQVLQEAHTPASHGYRPSLHRPSLQRPSPGTVASGRAGLPGEALLHRLQEEEACLLRELGRRRRAKEEELQEGAGKLEGCVLIPPLKR